MGLDLMLYKRSDVDAMENGLKPWDASMELAYGRKTWAISNFFTQRSAPYKGSDYDFIVPQAAWQEFYDTMAPVAAQLQAYTEEIFELEDRVIETQDEADATQDRYDWLNAELRQILEETLNESFFQLGAEWEASAVLNWLKAYDAVNQVYAEGEEVVLVQSY